MVKLSISLNFQTFTIHYIIGKFGLIKGQKKCEVMNYIAFSHFGTYSVSLFKDVLEKRQKIEDKIPFFP